jgi:hypothetical protein
VLMFCLCYAYDILRCLFGKYFSPNPKESLEGHFVTFKTLYNITFSPGHETFVYYVVRNANW